MAEQINEKIGAVTLAELNELSEFFSKATYSEGRKKSIEFMEQHGLDDQEALAVTRMAIAFKYDAPRQVVKSRG